MFGREAAGERTAPGRDGARKLQRYSGGEKVRHFRDDDTADLQTLVKRAKHGDDLHDLDAAFAHNVAARGRYKHKDMDVDDEYEVDGGLEMYEDRYATSSCTLCRLRQGHERACYTTALVLVLDAQGCRFCMLNSVLMVMHELLRVHDPCGLQAQAWHARAAAAACTKASRKRCSAHDICPGSMQAVLC